MLCALLENLFQHLMILQKYFDSLPDLELPAALHANRVKAVTVLSVRGGLQKIFNAQATSVHFQTVLNISSKAALKVTSSAKDGEANAHKGEAARADRTLSPQYSMPGDHLLTRKVFQHLKKGVDPGT